MPRDGICSTSENPAAPEQQRGAARTRVGLNLNEPALRRATHHAAEIATSRLPRAAAALRRASAASTEGGRYSKSRPGVDGISNTVHPLIHFGPLDGTRAAQIGQEEDRTRSSLSLVRQVWCGRAEAGCRQCHGEGRRPRSAAPLDRRRRTRGTSSPLPWRTGTALAARALWPGIPSVWPPACALSPPPAASSGFLPLQVPWRRCRRIQVCIAQCFFLQATWTVHDLAAEVMLITVI